MKKDLVARKMICVDLEVYQRLRRAVGPDAPSLNNAARKLLGMKPTGVRRGHPRGHPRGTKNRPKVA